MSDTDEIEISPNGEIKVDVKVKDEDVKDVKADDTQAIKTDDSVKDEVKDAVMITQKSPNELTEDERKYLINSAKSGKNDNPYFEVKFYKNGNARVCKRKTKAKSIAERAVENGGVHEVKDQKVYMSMDQLMWEHIVDLESKYTKLMSKHKKMKRRYNDIANELYVNEDDDESVKRNVETPIQQQQQQQVAQIQQQPEIQPKHYPLSNGNSWRSRLQYLA